MLEFLTGRHKGLGWLSLLVGQRTARVKAYGASLCTHARGKLGVVLS